MEIIQSEDNQYLKRIRQLKQKKYRSLYNEFVAEGSRFVEEAVLKKARIEMILAAEDYFETNSDFFKSLALPYVVVKKNLLEKSLNTVTPQGIAAIIKKPYWSLETLKAMEQVLIVDGVQDPGNLGTIIRTALSSGTEGVICLKGTVDLYNDKTLRATMGAIFTEPVYWFDDAKELVNLLHEAGFSIVLADIRAQEYYDEVTYGAKNALVVGNEGNGPQLIQTGDLLVKIPLYNDAESLNVAIAAGILLYTIKRQKKQQKILKS